MEIAWTESVLHSYFRVIDYLLEKWTKKELDTFEQTIDLLLEKISSNKELCPKIKFIRLQKMCC